MLNNDTIWQTNIFCFLEKEPRRKQMKREKIWYSNKIMI